MILMYDIDILNGVVHGTREDEFKVVLYFCSRVKKCCLRSLSGET